MVKKEILVDGHRYKLVEEEKENYCVDNFEAIKVNNELKLFEFGNEAEIETLPKADGVFVGKKYVSHIEDDGYNISIVLKGSESEIEGEVIWRNEE